MPEVASSPSAALSAEAARVGARLADLLAALPDAHADALADSTAFLRRMSAERPEAEPPAALERLCDALGLGEAERHAVVLAGLPEEHEGYAGVLRRLHPDGVPRPTAGLAAQLTCVDDGDRHTLRRALLSGPAAASGLLRLSGDAPFPERTLELCEGMWAELSGIEPAAPGTTEDAATVGLEDWLATAPAVRAAHALTTGETATILVVADTARTAVARAQALVAHAGRSALSAPPGDGDAAARLALRALVHDAIAVVALAAREPGEDSTAALLPDHPGPVVLAGRPGDAVTHGVRALLMVRAEPLPATARRRMWAGVLPELATEAGELAARHAVEPADAARIGSDARARARVDGRASPCPRDVADSASVRSAGALPAGVTVRRPRASWDSLVLSAERLAQLRAAIDRLRHQALVLDEWGFLGERPGARGVRMLLSGPPGTGKTLSAEVLAGALGVDLMIVDISRILSKWIGETEQRLAEVFDAAEPGHSVLLFDEADALFGKRTEISDAHDRYANVETAYLLQRLERFEGLAILTTNLRNNIDEAFTRRIEFVVELTEPGPAEREALWLAHLPDTAPLAEDLHPAELAARYPVVGGVIRNASVAAAFLAAADAGPITRDHVLLALEREYEKHGRAFPGRPPLSRRANHAIPAQGA